MTDLSPITSALITAAAGMVTTLSLAGIALLPRLWSWLGARIHGANRQLLELAIDNAAQNAVSGYSLTSGLMQTSIRDMVLYVKNSLPDTVVALKVSDETLKAMCSAAFARVMTERRASQILGTGPRP